MSCKIPPRGWFCTREADHDGPCAAWPDTWRNRIKTFVRKRKVRPHEESRAKDQTRILEQAAEIETLRTALQELIVEHQRVRLAFNRDDARRGYIDEAVAKAKKVLGT